jgi:hypothetical protein
MNYNCNKIILPVKNCPPVKTIPNASDNTNSLFLSFLTVLMPQTVAVWYCCRCHFGPLNVSNDVACPNCDRKRCPDCPVQMAYAKKALGGDEGTSPYPGVPGIFDPERQHYAAISSPSRSGLSLTASPSLHLTASAGINRQRGGTVTCPSKTYIYICCQCNDGPKVYNHQVMCVNCDHLICDSCVEV